MAATYIVVTNAGTSNLSITGDDGKPRVDVSASAGSNTTNINISDLLGNNLLCTGLSTWVTAGTVTVTRGGTAVTAADFTAWAQGSDMNRSDYDTDDDGIVDTAQAVTVSDQTAVAFAASPYTILSTDDCIIVDTTGGAVEVDLPTAVGITGKSYMIVDSGNAGTANVTIDPNGTEQIDDGGAGVAIVLDVNHGMVELISDNVGWFTKQARDASSETAITAVELSIATNVLVTQTAVAAAASPYTVLATDDTILADTSAAAPLTLLLPTAVGITGKRYMITDSGGTAATDNITITPDGTEEIDNGGAGVSVVINVDNGSVLLVSDGANWYSEQARIEALEDTVGAWTSPGASMSYQAVAATVTTVEWVAPAAGNITGFSAIAGTTAAAAEDMTFDVTIGGVTALTGVVTVDNAAGITVVLGTVDGAADDFVAGDVIRVARVYTAGGGPTPMALTSAVINWELT